MFHNSSYTLVVGCTVSPPLLQCIVVSYNLMAYLAIAIILLMEYNCDGGYIIVQLVSLKGYKKIYAVDSFFDEFKKLFGKDTHTYELEKKSLLTSLDLLDQHPLLELLKMGARFERLSNEELYVIRHVSKTNLRCIFVTGDEDGNFYLLNSFLEKSRGDYEIAKDRAKGIIKKISQGGDSV